MYKIRFNNTSAMSLVSYVLGIIFPAFHPYDILSYVLYQCLFSTERRLYLIKVLDENQMMSVLKDNQIACGTTSDLSNTVLIGGGNQVPRKIHGLSRIIVRSRTTVKRNVFVISVPTTLSNHYQILISPILFHNLNLNNTKPVFLCQIEFDMYTVISPKYLSDLKLSLINCPTSNKNGKTLSVPILDSLLKSYFANTKIFYDNDIVAIDMKQYGGSIYHIQNQISDLNEVYHFKCRKIDENDDFHLCRVDQTTLVQLENVQCFVPKKCAIFPTINGRKSLHLPYGLRTQAQILKRAVRPFLTKTKVPFDPIFLLTAPKGSGKLMILSDLTSNLGLHLYRVRTFELLTNIYAQTEIKIRNVIANAKSMAPCILLIEDFENFGKNAEDEYDDRITSYFVNEINTILFKNNSYPVLLFCSNDTENKLAPGMQELFLKNFVFKPPQTEERYLNIKWFLEYYEIDVFNNDLIRDVAGKTHGFVLEDLKTLIYHAVCDFRRQHTNSKWENVQLDANNLQYALDLMESTYKEAIGAPKVPKILWSHIGGLADVKEEVMETFQLGLLNEEFAQKDVNLKRSGILFYGPPGTGKTLIAKAIATECGMCFLSVKGPELLNMYVGQSEENIRKVFDKARGASPCIIFFDELDSLAPNRGFSGDSGGVMDRVVSQLLAEMDGVTERGNIFIIGATNRPDLIDTALLRPGRFDKLIYIGPCTDYDSKLAVLNVQTKKFNLDKSFQLEDVIRMCPLQVSGADIYGICSNAWMAAVRRLINSTENPHELNQNDIIVTLDDFKCAIDNSQSTISQSDMDYFEKMRNKS